MKHLIIIAGALAVACIPAVGSAAPAKHHKVHHDYYANRSVRNAYGAYGAYGMTAIPDASMPDYAVMGPAYYYCQDPNVVTVDRCPISSNGQ